MMREDRGLSAFRTSAAGCGPTGRRNPGSGRGTRPCGLAQISARRLDIPADGTSTRRRPTPHPVIRRRDGQPSLWLAPAAALSDGIGRRQPSHRATRLPIDRYNNDGRGAFTSSQRWVQGLRCGGAHECSRCADWTAPWTLLSSLAKADRTFFVIARRARAPRAPGRPSRARWTRVSLLAAPTRWLCRRPDGPRGAEPARKAGRLAGRVVPAPRQSGAAGPGGQPRRAAATSSRCQPAPR